LHASDPSGGPTPSRTEWGRWPASPVHAGPASRRTRSWLSPSACPRRCIVPRVVRALWPVKGRVPRPIERRAAAPDEGYNQHAINMQSECSQHAISMQSACNQHAIIIQSACNQHAIRVPHMGPAGCIGRMDGKGDWGEIGAVDCRAEGGGFALESTDEGGN
jgi:hypothetical protein